MTKISLDAFYDELQKISELIPGGKSSGMPPSKFNPASVAKGQKVEIEHTTDPRIAREISRDHISEFPRYYTALDEMEKKLKGERKKVSQAVFQKMASHQKEAINWGALGGKLTQPFTRLFTKAAPAVAKAAPVTPKAVTPIARTAPMSALGPRLKPPSAGRIGETIGAPLRGDPRKYLQGNF
jgi:hypothetical protein